MEDIKDLVSSLTVTGIAVLRNSKARRQLVKMVWIQLGRNRRPLRIALFISFLSVVLSYVVGRYVIYRVFLHPANRYAGPPPFTGHLHQLFSKDTGVMYRIWAQKYGRVFRYFGKANSPRVVVADSKFVEHIISNSDSKPHPLLPSEQYERLVPSIVKPIQQLADQWRLYCATEVVVSHGLRLVALEIFAQTVLGHSLDSIHDTHRHAFNRAFLAQQQSNQSNPTLWDLSRRFLSRAPKNTTPLEQETLALVASASQRLDSTSPALLAHWMQKPATLKDLQHQAMDALTEVHETIHGVTSWSLYRLAENPDLQATLRTVPPDDPFLDAFCKEAFRWTPLVPESHHIINGTHWVVSPLVLHFDSRYWGDDVDQFLPSRWYRAPANKISPFVYLPGASDLAIKQLKLVLTVLLQQFKFTVKPGFNVRASLSWSCRPMPHMSLLLEPIDNTDYVDVDQE